MDGRPHGQRALLPADTVCRSRSCVGIGNALLRGADASHRGRQGHLYRGEPRQLRDRAAIPVAARVPLLLSLRSTDIRGTGYSLIDASIVHLLDALQPGRDTTGTYCDVLDVVPCCWGRRFRAQMEPQGPGSRGSKALGVGSEMPIEHLLADDRPVRFLISKRCSINLPHLSRSRSRDLFLF